MDDKEIMRKALKALKEFVDDKEIMRKALKALKESLGGTRKKVVRDNSDSLNEHASELLSACRTVMELWELGETNWGGDAAIDVFRHLDDVIEKATGENDE